MSRYRILFSLLNNTTKNYKIFTNKIQFKISGIHSLKKSSIFIRAFSNMPGNIVNFEEVKNLQNDKNAYIIDVRSPSELAETGSIPGSINIPLADLDSFLKNCSNQEFEKKFGRSKPNKDSLIVFSCKSGKRAESATNAAMALGYSNVHTYQGSWSDWEAHTKN